MEKTNLENVIDIAYLFLEKARDESSKMSYNKLQCIIYQSNKTYYHYKNELLYNINTITSDIIPVNMDILTEFSSFRDKEYISYVLRQESKISPINLMKTIFLEYIWDKYSPANDKSILDYTLKDIVFENKSGVSITEDSFSNEKKDEGAKNYMDFLTV